MEFPLNRRKLRVKHIANLHRNGFKFNKIITAWRGKPAMHPNLNPNRLRRIPSVFA